MDYKKLASTIAGAAVALYGCGDPSTPPSGHEFPERDKVCVSGATQPCATTADAHTAAERTHEEGSELDNATLTYVVNLLSLPDVMDGKAAGFNLDGLDSGEGSSAADPTCEEYARDYASLTDPDHVGVDNALVAALDLIASQITGECASDPAPLDCTIRSQIASGSVILLVEVTGVDSLEYDSEIHMQLFRGQVSGGGMPTLGSDGLLTADQTFEVLEALGDPVAGDIFEGRVRATTPLLSLQITAAGATIPLNIMSPQVRFDIADGALTNGAIGGVISLDDLVVAAAGFGIDEATVRSVVGQFADVHPSAADPMNCDSLSVGITFGATTATRTGG